MSRNGTASAGRGAWWHVTHGIARCGDAPQLAARTPISWQAAHRRGDVVAASTAMIRAIAPAATIATTRTARLKRRGDGAAWSAFTESTVRSRSLSPASTYFTRPSAGSWFSFGTSP
jgi:hypothetical protein